MCKKYIIELEEPAKDIDDVKYYPVKNIPWWMISQQNVDRLTPYDPLLDKAEYDSAIADAEKRGAEKAWEFACHLFNVSPDVTNEIYLSMNGGKGLGVALEMPYIEAMEMYENWKLFKESHERLTRKKVEELADEIGIHRLYAIVKDIRGE